VGGGGHASRSFRNGFIAHGISTGYRLWSSRGDPVPGNPDPNAATTAVGEETSALTSALAREVSPPSSLVKPAETNGSPVSSKGTLSEDPPPPAYEESVAPTTGATGMGRTRIGEADEWVDMDDVGGSSIYSSSDSVDWV
jgi:hypothetical protein